MKPKLLSSLTPNKRNPRTISDAQLAMLDASLREFGDLSGVVYNRTTKSLVGGHQRIKTFQADKKATVEITETHKRDKQGTIARGFIRLSDGSRHAYREVEWPAPKEKAAMIAANKHGGEWDQALLADLLSSLKGEIDLNLTGFSEADLEGLLQKFSIPAGNQPIDETALAETNCECPKCGFQWKK